MRFHADIYLPDGYDENEPEVRVFAEITPGRPAPRCCNPSLPAYSDPGSPTEVDVLSVLIDDDKGQRDIMHGLPEWVLYELRIDVLCRWRALHEVRYG